MQRGHSEEGKGDRCVRGGSTSAILGAWLRVCEGRNHIHSVSRSLISEMTGTIHNIMTALEEGGCCCISDDDAASVWQQTELVYLHELETNNTVEDIESV